jgi:hypothetical protein
VKGGIRDTLLQSCKCLTEDQNPPNRTRTLCVGWTYRVTTSDTK